jgi:threonine-phosphate decarboxylase
MFLFLFLILQIIFKALIESFLNRGEGMEWPNHGGQPAAILERLKLPDNQPMLDFSANLNPLGPPDWLKERWQEVLPQIEKYPDPSYIKERRSLAHLISIESHHLLLTNGGAEAIFLAARLVAGKRMLLVHPCFSEYAQAAKHYDISMTDLYLDAEANFSFPTEQVIAQFDKVDAIMVGRPNNPTGTLISREEIRLILEEARKKQVNVIIDEAFIDFLPTSSALTDLIHHYPNLILLRSLTKMFTIPGLRIGLVLADCSLIKQLSVLQQPWSVNAVAAALAPQMLQDQSFIDKTQKWLGSETKLLSKQLSLLGYEMVS